MMKTILSLFIFLPFAVLVKKLTASHGRTTWLKHG